jgi:hypothetical protein
MRTDVVELLNRLEQLNFHYQEFSDQFSDMELWPIFEAILTDADVVGKPLSLVAAREVSALQEDRQALSAPALQNAPVVTRSDAVVGLFEHYDARARIPPDHANEGVNEDVKAFLSRLSARQVGEGTVWR